MNKDIIYIDVEDDITAIIGKVKQSREKIVALVPPKRIGVLQSAVNLRLLSRTATQNGKHLVLITGNGALTALAAAAKIPVAKNLQSKPEIGTTPEEDVDTEDDIIDGSQLPVGELARTADRGAPFTAVSPAVDAAVRENAAEEKGHKAVAARSRQTRAKSGVKVPSFDSFRKKLLLIGAGGALLIGVLVWAIFFAPRANVVIAARTIDTPVNARVTLDPAVTTSLQEGILRSVTKQIKKDQTVDFTATGKKEVGEKATGTVKFSTNNISNLGTTIPAGTVLTSSTGRTYATDQTVTMTISNYRGANTSITAVERGSSSNGVSGNVTGAPSGISASLVGSTAGGTDKTVTVVTSGDIQKATEQLAEQKTDDIKKELARQFDGTFVVIDQSFKIDQADPVATPAADQESTDGKAKLTSAATYSLSAVAKTDVKQYLDDYFKAELKDKEDQRVYDNGSGSAKLSNITVVDGGKFGANLVANAKIGPKIDDDEVKQLAAGKRYGDIQASLEAIQGVESVDVEYSPFWVTSTPNDTKRITVEFKLSNDK